jgi:hypothetical protein
MKRDLAGEAEIKRALETCELCTKKGVIESDGNRFCSKAHMYLFDEKMEDAIFRQSELKNCSVCEKPVKNSKWQIIDCRTDIKDPFIPHRFCSEKHFDECGA